MKAQAVELCELRSEPPGVRDSLEKRDAGRVVARLFLLVAAVRGG